MREAAGANYSTATDLADYLVRKGLPFREAHEIVGRAVRHGIANKRELGEMSLEELRGFSPLIGADVHAALTVEASLRRARGDGRDGAGGGGARARRRPASSWGPSRAGEGALRAGPRPRLLLLAAVADAGCGKKGPPVAPERRLPARPSGPGRLRGGRQHRGELDRTRAPAWTARRCATSPSSSSTGARRPPASPPSPPWSRAGAVVGWDELAVDQARRARARRDRRATPSAGWTGRAWRFDRRYVYVVTAQDSTGRSSAPSERARRGLPRGAAARRRRWPPRRASARSG